MGWLASLLAGVAACGCSAARDAPPELSAHPLPLSDVELRGDWSEAQRRDQEVLMSLNVSRLACHFTSTANLTRCIDGEGAGGKCVAPGSQDRPACQPLPGELGLGMYYGHYQGHWLSATAFIVNSTRDAAVKARADAVLAVLARVMRAWRAKYGYDGYLFPYDPLVFDQLLAGRGSAPYYSVPFYTLHKIMAGLLDQHLHAGSALALELLEKMADWTHRVVEAAIAQGGQALWQQVLLTEWGGMNDVLFQLFRHSGNPQHLATARRFNGWVFSEPLARGHDDLSELPFPHANFRLPEVVGFAQAYELTGNATDAAIARTFFGALTRNHSFCTGGSNSGECWQRPRDLGAFLTPQTQESCTQYNVLKVARHLFQWSADPAVADFYERAILNGIIGNQNRLDPSMTSYIYMLPLGAGNGPAGGVVKKPWGRSDSSFPCCWGTLSESFAKLGDSIYFVQPERRAVYVNQFVPSRAALPQLGVSIEQDSDLLASPTGTTKITVSAAEGTELSLRVRVPGWLQLPGTVRLNGRALAPPFRPGTYFEIRRTWSDGDTVEVSFPPSLWAEPLNDDHAEYNATMAFMYGPLVLAGVDVETDIFVPKSQDYRARPASFITRTSANKLEFEAAASDGRRMRMIPLRDVMLEPYAVYFMTAGTKPPQARLPYCPRSRQLTPAPAAKGHGAQPEHVDGATVIHA